MFHSNSKKFLQEYAFPSRDTYHFESVGPHGVRCYAVQMGVPLPVKLFAHAHGGNEMKWKITNSFRA